MEYFWDKKVLYGAMFTEAMIEKYKNYVNVLCNLVLSSLCLFVGVK